MKFVCLAIIALCASVVAATALPPGFNSATDIANVLASEPEAAKEARFAEVGGDNIVFKDSSAGAPTTGSTGSEDDTDSEFDAQLEQIENDKKKLAEAIKESQECADRLKEQESEMQSLNEQKEHLEREKDKRVLQAKLEKQMKDLAEINRMSRALRAKFAELKRTQKIIKAKMSGTRSSLNQLDEEPAVDEDVIKEVPENLAEEMNSMQSAQKKILENAHKQQASGVKASLDQANKFHGY